MNQEACNTAHKVGTQAKRVGLMKDLKVSLGQEGICRARSSIWFPYFLQLLVCRLKGYLIEMRFRRSISRHSGMCYADISLTCMWKAPGEVPYLSLLLKFRSYYLQTEPGRTALPLWFGDELGFRKPLKTRMSKAWSLRVALIRAGGYFRKCSWMGSP